MKEYKDLDEILAKSLSCDEKPSKVLNINLKSEIAEKYNKEKSVSIWWMPMIFSLLIGIVCCLFIGMFISITWIRQLLFVTSFTVVILNLAITFIGVRYLELSKGAEISI